MSKFSCKTSNFKSSVVVLKDGCAMEVRRGENTKFTSAEPRRYWPSLDAWKATLPEGAPVVKSKSYIPVRKMTTTNPVLAQFMKRLRKVPLVMRRANIFCVGTRGDLLYKEMAYHKQLAELSTGNPELLKLCIEKYMKEAAKIAEVIKAGKAKEKIYAGHTKFLTVTPEGEIAYVFYNIEENMLVTEIPNGRGERFLDRIYTPITSIDKPLWYMDNKGYLKKF